MSGVFLSAPELRKIRGNMKLLEKVEVEGRSFEVSTVLLPMGISPSPHYPFETLIFEVGVREDGGDVAICGPIPYKTSEEAEKGHAQTVQDLREGRIKLGVDEDEE